MRYAIIGASAAGISAAKTLRENDKSCEIKVFTKESYLPYSRPIISYYLKDKVGLDKIYLNDKSFYSDNKIDIELNTEITAVDAVQKKVLFDGGEYKFDKCLCATGSKPFLPAIENVAAQENVYTFLDMEQSEKIRAAASSKTKAVVIGAGLIGLKAAEGLRKITDSVTVVELAPKVLPSILNDEAAQMVKNHLINNGIDILLGDTVVKADGDKKITSVTLKSGKTLQCDMLVLAVGVRPEISLLEKAGAKTERGILVNKNTMETTIKGIYAAGDCVSSYDILDEKQKIIALWPNAVREGKTAALNMCGSSHNDEGSFAVNAIDFFGLRICTCGLISDENAEELIKSYENSYKRLLVKDNKLVGFVLINNSEKAGIYTGLIKNKIDLDTLQGDIMGSPDLMLFKKCDRTQKLTGGANI